ncbi:Pycsar system effector family protein [uncultured Flavobacterium sp.]|uniref:Pycsar system effector family protein n=1 Tax=uncultured Flavobacterium sp. TaxID=165435 RepID=UPI0025EDECA2|nr:Pycsar system effector family protein [uncultured Flavobacterium sp.]
MNIAQKAENYVFQLFKDSLSPDYIYHNFNHTLRVVNSVKILIENENVSPEDAELLLIASWFHDSGYVEGGENHEKRSAKIAEAFLKDNNFPEEKIEKIKSFIIATEMTRLPETHLEKIMRDADCSHFGDKDYFNYSDLLREEWKATSGKEFSKLEWAEENLRFFVNGHRFFTDYAQRNWQPQKDANIAIIQDKIKSSKKGKKEKDRTKDILNQKKLEKFDSPERGIDTMFRVTLNNHTKLSQIADSKANILLSVNAIIISIALSTLIPKLDSPTNAHLIVPTFIMLMFSVVSIIFAILSTRPKVSGGTFTRKDIEEKKVNLLFFGNFHKMPLEEYQWAVNEMMKDREYLYNSMIKDLYYLGLVLDRKYKLLRSTYTIFMIGIITSVIAFVFAFKSV